jgi:AraC-like DNA-binding protein
MQVEESVSELGRWRTVRRSSSSPLAPHVRGYFGSDGFLPTALRERHLPTASVALVVNFSSPHRLIERDASEMSWGERAWVVGLQTRHRASEAVGTRDFLAVTLTPTGAWRLLRTPMHALADRVVDLADIDPRFARRLLARVDRARGWEARLETLETTLMQRLDAEAASDPIVPRVLGRLSADIGKVDLGRLAAELGRSHRYLIAQFREQVGLPPKAMARLLRFNRAIAAINHKRRLTYLEGRPYLEGRAQPEIAEPVRWSDLALACGYYDQAHFINEFRAFAGCSPAAFLRQLRGDPAAAAN